MATDERNSQQCAHGHTNEGWLLAGLPGQAERHGYGTRELQ